tara:strand:+ start:43845 stop:45029 length:1185 start_codon:yes stop_codon:yes gene_type:complete
MSTEAIKIHRLLDMDLPVGQSAFLWGPRKSGKSTFLKERYPKAVYYDLLDSELVLSLAKEPYQLRREIEKLSAEQLQEPIIIDEIQKVPELLDEVHWMIENTDAYFIMCGSSARKLRRGAANLLGGRAWRYEFYPLVYPEVPDFDLLRAMNHGLIPSHYLRETPQKDLGAYVAEYIQEEIQAEGLVRNLVGFSRFLDAIAFSHGEMTNYANIARDCAIDAKTVKEYYQILIDTMLGYYVEPYRKKVSRDIITSIPKFYLFDMGVANYLAQESVQDLVGARAGKSLEHFILTELMAYRGLKEKRFDICYWRTKSGLEVDFILNRGKVAIEVKISRLVRKTDIKGLRAFVEEHKPERAIVVSQDRAPSKLPINDEQSVDVLPWKVFLDELWEGKII